MSNKCILISKLKRINVNEDILIYEGEYSLLQKELTLQIIGSVYFKWLPTPNIKFKGKVKNKPNNLKKFWENNEFEIRLPNGYRGKAFLTSIDIFNVKLTGELKSELILKRSDEQFEKLRFAIVNFRNNFGIYINGVSDPKIRYSGRLYFNYGDFEISIDKRENYKDLYDGLKNNGGYCITHFAELKRKDNNTFDLEEVEVIIEALNWLLSFSCGRQIGFCYFLGINNSKIVLEKYSAPLVESWREITNWYPKKENSNIILGHIFDELVNKLKHGLWKRVLKNIFSWYFDAERNTYIETRIVSTQIALENFARNFIVEDKKIMNRNQFNKQYASDKLRLLFNKFNIPIKSPIVEEFSSIKNFDDGVHLFTSMRNSIAHPKRNDKLVTVNWENKYKVLQLGVNYLELSILCFLGYKGKYYNRLENERMYKDCIEVVPWSSQNEYKLLVNDFIENVLNIKDDQTKQSI